MKTISIVLFLFFCFSFCTIDNKETIGVLLPDLKKERWRKDEAFIKQHAKELNLELTVFDADGNEQLQYKQAQELIDKGVKVIIIGSVNATLSAAIVRNAHKKNIKVIAYDRFIKNCDLDYYVSHNNIEVGEMMTKYLTSLKPMGNYMLLYGDRADQNAIFVKEGILNVIQPLVNSSKIKIVYESFIEGWQGSESYLDVDRFLRYSKDSVDVILATGDGMAQGVIKSLAENNLAGKVLVSGQNADLVAIKSIIKGDQAVTIYKPLKDLASTALNLANQLINNKSPDNIGTHINNGKIDVPSILIPVFLVNKDNIDEVLIKNGFYTKEEAYGK
jgi:D-xylose transport system substrate-binding protein